MKTVILGAAAAGVLAFGQQPEIIQTPTDIIIRLNAPSASPGVQTSVGDLSQLPAAQAVARAAVKGAPYSAEAVTETTPTSADGGHATTRQSAMIYRDGMGRERREMERSGSKSVTITDPATNTTYSLDPTRHTAIMLHTLMALDADGGAVKDGGISVSGRMIPGGQPPLESVKTEDLGSKLVEGIQANGKRETRAAPTGRIVDETWYSPELQTTLTSVHRDPRVGETVYKLTNIVRAEPDAALFQIPRDYQIVERPIFTTKQ